MNAANSAGTSGWSPVWSFRTVDPASPTFTLRTNIPFPEGKRPSELTERDYKLIGLPGASNAQITSYLPGTPGTDWQVYWDNGAAENYLIPYNGGPEFAFSVGKAFWMIKAGSWVVDASVPVPPRNESGEVEIVLQEGWNLITNPFLAPVNWTEVQALNSTTQPIYAFLGGSYSFSASLEPFAGYYFFNATSLARLRIRNDTTSTTARMVQPLLSSSTGWRVNIVFRSESSVDGMLWLGTSPEAQKGYDFTDFRKPRGLSSSPGTFFSRPEWDIKYRSFAMDIRSPTSDFEQWDFDVRTISGKAVELSFSGIESVPAELAIYLVDRERCVSADLRKTQTYRFLTSKKETKLTVVVGRPQDVEKNLPDQRALTNISLGVNYPNPFNLSTTIPFELSQRASVLMTIHNLLGQQIRTVFAGELDRGLHSGLWDGTDASGGVVPSGVYFCRLSTTDGRTVTRSLILAK